MLLDRLALGALLLPLVCAEAVPTLTLHDQVVLTGARYRLVDVGMLACNEQPDCVALGALFLGTAPRPGTTARVSKVQLQAQLRQLGLPAAGRLAWAGADSVAITASAQSVPARATGKHRPCCLDTGFGRGWPGNHGRRANCTIAGAGWRCEPARPAGVACAA